MDSSWPNSVFPHNSSLERVLGAMSAERISIETMDYGFLSKMGEMKMASQEKQNGASLSFVAPSNEELQVQKVKFDWNHGISESTVILSM